MVQALVLDSDRWWSLSGARIASISLQNGENVYGIILSSISAMAIGSALTENVNDLKAESYRQVTGKLTD